MSNKGSNLGKNPFETALRSSVNNGCEISLKTLQALQAQSSTDLQKE